VHTDACAFDRMHILDRVWFVYLRSRFLHMCFFAAQYVLAVFHQRFEHMSEYVLGKDIIACILAGRIELRQ